MNFGKLKRILRFKGTTSLRLEPSDGELWFIAAVRVTYTGGAAPAMTRLALSQNAQFIWSVAVPMANGGGELNGMIGGGMSVPLLTILDTVTGVPTYDDQVLSVPLPMIPLDQSAHVLVMDDVTMTEIVATVMAFDIS